ncbi:MAG: TrmB family transcriptional regulator [Clostridiaceae bacterium]|nr:TrmB family transcriptional regulator [Clostridiaceae bacterium]
MQLIDSLMTIGLSRHEAELYVLLHREGPMTGYEASKLTGISRSNAYPALSALTEKGAAWTIAGDVQKYTAVPVVDFCSSKRRQFNDTIDWIEQHMPAIQTAAEPYITIAGRQNIMDQIRNLINAANLRVYAALDNIMTAELMPELSSATARGLKVVLIADLDKVPAGMTIYRKSRDSGQIRLITDSSQVITGDISGDNEPICLYSQNSNLVTLFKEAMVNEIALIRLTDQGTDTEFGGE